MENTMFKHNNNPLQENDPRNSKLVRLTSFRKENPCSIKEATSKMESDCSSKKDSDSIRAPTCHAPSPSMTIKLYIHWENKLSCTTCWQKYNELSILSARMKKSPASSTSRTWCWMITSSTPWLLLPKHIPFSSSKILAKGTTIDTFFPISKKNKQSFA